MSARIARLAALAGATAVAVLAAYALDAPRLAAQSCGPPSSAASSEASDDPADSNDRSSANDDASSTGNDFAPITTSDDGHADDDSPPARPSCTDRSDLTGFEECTRFGAGWDRSAVPRFRFDAGGSFRRISLSRVTLGGEVFHGGNPHRYELRGSDLADPTADVGSLDLRFTTVLGQNFILGAELSLFGGGAPDGSVTYGDLTIEAGPIAGLGGGAIAGVAIPIGPLRLRAEVLAGARALFVTATSHLGSCVSEHDTVVTRFVLEPRLAVEWFTTPWLSLEAWGGADVIDHGTFAAGGSVTFHLRSFDGIGGD